MAVLPALLILGCTSLVHAGNVNIAQTGEANNETQVELRCPDWRVLQVLGQVGALCQQASVDRAAPPSCVQPLPPSALRPSCNGRQLCNETVQVPQDTLCPDGTPPQSFNVSYACVSQTLTTNICSNERQDLSPVYLASPGFLGLLLDRVSKPHCRCRVRGEGLTVTAVEVDLPSQASSSLSLSQARDGSTLWSSQQHQSGPHFHTVLYSSSTELQTVDITLNSSDATHLRAWIQVIAVKGDIEMGCGVRASHVPTAPPPLTSSTVTPPARETASTERTVDSWTICSTQSGTSIEGGTATSTPESAVSSSPSSSSAFSSSSSQRSIVTVAGPFSGDVLNKLLVSVVVLSVLCVLLAVALVVSNLYHLRGRLCGGRDPTYAQREAPVPEDTPPYTELRIYQNPALEQST